MQRMRNQCKSLLEIFSLQAGLTNNGKKCAKGNFFFRIGDDDRIDIQPEFLVAALLSGQDKAMFNEHGNNMP